MVLLKLPYRALSLFPKKLFQGMRSTRHLLWPRLPLQGQFDTDPGLQVAFTAQFSQSSTEGPEITHRCSRCCAEGRWKCQVNLAHHLLNHVYDATWKTHTPHSAHTVCPFQIFLPTSPRQSGILLLPPKLCDGAQLWHALDQLLPAAQRSASLPQLCSLGEKIQKHKRRNKSVRRK